MTDTRRDVAERLPLDPAPCPVCGNPDLWYDGQDIRCDVRRKNGCGIKVGSSWEHYEEVVARWNALPRVEIRSEGREPDAFVADGALRLFRVSSEGSYLPAFHDPEAVKRPVPVYFGTPTDSPTETDPKAAYMNARTCICGEDAALHRCPTRGEKAGGFDPDWQALRERYFDLRVSDSPEREDGTSDPADLLREWLAMETEIVRNSYCTAAERDDPERVDVAWSYEAPESFRLAVATREWLARREADDA